MSVHVCMCLCVQRKMKMKQLQSLCEVEGVEGGESELVMRFPTPYGVFASNENLISVQDASFGWGSTASSSSSNLESSTEADNLLFEKVDFVIGSKARIAILGRNGCGKWHAVPHFPPLVHFLSG